MLRSPGASFVLVTSFLILLGDKERRRRRRKEQLDEIVCASERKDKNENDVKERKEELSFLTLCT